MSEVTKDNVVITDETGKELKFLKDNYDKLTYEEISNILGRTTKAVSAKAKELGYQKRKIKKEDE